jgi:hypothetical protein
MAKIVPEGTTQAYINHGRFIADCPTPFCNSAEGMKAIGQSSMICIDCHVMSPVVWPNRPEALMAALEKRPDPTTRNWFPAGHGLAKLGGYPQDQSVAELDAETAQNLDKDSDRRAKKRQARQALAELGITVDEDGTIHGRL